MRAETSVNLRDGDNKPARRPEGTLPPRRPGRARAL